LAEKNRELAVTSDYLGSVMESMSDGVVAVDANEVITTFNGAACTILGYAAEDVLGRRFRDVFGREFIVPPGRQAMTLRAAGGTEVSVSESDSPLTGRQRTRIGTVKVFQDLTELEALRTQVRRKDRLAAIGEMAATVAHEIRNPLGGIRGFASLLARDVEGNAGCARLVDKILMGTRDLERVVEELLEYTRPLELRLRQSSAADLVDAAAGFLQDVPPGVRVENGVGPGCDLMVDPDRMRQVFLNILMNGVQSLGDSGSVRVEAAREDGWLRVAFRDTGCGIPPDKLEQVFLPFFTTKEKGTGLGLAVAAKIVESHGGRIDLDSEPGRGTCMTVCLPVSG
jgi:PAS domain S-box-containing protein